MEQVSFDDTFYMRDVEPSGFFPVWVCAQPRLIEETEAATSLEDGSPLFTHDWVGPSGSQIPNELFLLPFIFSNGSGCLSLFDTSPPRFRHPSPRSAYLGAYLTLSRPLNNFLEEKVLNLSTLCMFFTEPFPNCRVVSESSPRAQPCYQPLLIMFRALISFFHSFWTPILSECAADDFFFFLKKGKPLGGLIGHH